MVVHRTTFEPLANRSRTTREPLVHHLWTILSVPRTILWFTSGSRAVREWFTSRSKVVQTWFEDPPKTVRGTILSTVSNHRWDRLKRRSNHCCGARHACDRGVVTTSGRYKFYAQVGPPKILLEMLPLLRRSSSRAACGLLGLRRYSR